MTNPIGFSPSQYLITPGVVTPVNPPANGINPQEPPSDDMAVKGKPRSDETLQGKGVKDCKT